MALIPDNVRTHESTEGIERRFGIAQDGRPTQAQLKEQAALRSAISAVAVRLNQNVADSRSKSLALTSLEEALMWAGKAIFE